MKTKFILLFIFLKCLVLSVNAQKDYKLSVFYDYSIKLNIGKFNYPLGFGSNISKSISEKLLLSAGLEYAHFSDEYQSAFSPSGYRTMVNQKESILSLTSGLSYPFLQKNLVLRVGGDIVASKFLYRSDLYRYIIANDSMDLSIKSKYVSFGLGLRIKADIEYHLTKGIYIFVQPGYTYYLFGEALKNKFFSAAAGLSFNI